MATPTECTQLSYNLQCAQCTRNATYRLSLAKSVYPLCGRHFFGNTRVINGQRVRCIPLDKTDETLMCERVIHDERIVEAKIVPIGIGHVVCHKLYQVAQYPMHLLVIPNVRFGRHPYVHFDGYSLSPGVLGPVDHQQPGLPMATTLRHFIQGSAARVGRHINPDGRTLSESFYVERRAVYTGQTNIVGGTVAFFVHVGKDGVERHLTEFEFRSIACTHYERLVSKTKAYAKMRKKINEGYNIVVAGPSAQEFDVYTDAAATYSNPKRAFGHECVLATMLALPPNKWPWRNVRPVA